MRAFYPNMLLIIVLASCTQEEPTPLIKGYTKDWESDLGSRYAEYFPVPGKTTVFRFLHINTDGTLVILHTPEISPIKWTLTKVSPSGEFIMDVIIPEEYISEIAMDDQGNLETLSYNESTRIVRKWNSDLTVIQSTSILFPVPPTFNWMRLHNSSYYFGDYQYDAQNNPVWNITKYGLDGTLKWTKLLSEYGVNGLQQPFFFGERDELLFVRFTQDSIRYSKVNGSTGEIIWARRFLLTEFGNPLYYPFFAPLNSGKVLVVGHPYPGIKNWSIVNQAGMIRFQSTVDFPDEELSYLSGIVEEEDGGFLITVGSDLQTSPASFKLLKLDSKLNVGWVGTFNQLYPGYVAQLKKSNDQVVVLTSNGYLYGLKRQY